MILLICGVQKRQIRRDRIPGCRGLGRMGGDCSGDRWVSFGVLELFWTYTAVMATQLCEYPNKH